MKFSTNNANCGYYTLKLTDGLEFITKTFTRERNFENIELPALYFDRPNTLFWFDGTDYANLLHTK